MARLLIYDLKANPYEMNNLIDDAGARSAVKEMQAELENLRKETR